MPTLRGLNYCRVGTYCPPITSKLLLIVRNKHLYGGHKCPPYGGLLNNCKMGTRRPPITSKLLFIVRNKHVYGGHKCPPYGTTEYQIKHLVGWALVAHQ